MRNKNNRVKHNEKKLITVSYKQSASYLNCLQGLGWIIDHLCPYIKVPIRSFDIYGHFCVSKKNYKYSG